MNVELECAICLEKINEEYNYAITPCSHKFCFNCILQSIQTINTCPYCRRILIVEEESYDETEENNQNSYIQKIILNIKRILHEGFTVKELYYIMSILFLKNYFSIILISNKINYINNIIKEECFNNFLYNDFLYNIFIYNNTNI